MGINELLTIKTSFDWQKPFRTVDGRRAEIIMEFDNGDGLMTVHIWEPIQFGLKSAIPYLYHRDTGWPIESCFSQNKAWKLVNIDAE